MSSPGSEAGSESDEDRRPDDHRSGRGGTPANPLDRVRRESRIHAVALIAAVAIGLVAAWLHWAGLLLGGALVGLVAPTLRRAVLGTIGFGALVLVVFAVSLGGSVGAVVGMVPVVYLVVAAAFGLPLFGSLVRGLI
ncbi:hypothetical protein ACFO5R_16935 [Halosolutus amylolyticus]|uniref:Major facilitator superfamily (MFS) profile domain-containing protein n=1 Tax=Halosolutus amylolyticus TaxID=2932267 RepID=A0ABD5PT13_9EURY|nr:hypothetical protein [Halosolutus amylolyticus]